MRQDEARGTVRSGRPTARVPKDDRGAAVVLVAAMVGLLCFVAVALTGVGAVVLTHQRAQAAADLAALAGAAAAQAGRDGCEAAAHTARLNGAEPSRCHLEDADIVLEVAVALPGALATWGSIVAPARAGPS